MSEGFCGFWLNRLGKPGRKCLVSAFQVLGFLKFWTFKYWASKSRTIKSWPF